VQRFHLATAQPEVGHLGRVRALRERLAAMGALHVVGAAYDGPGVAGCVRGAKRVAEAIACAGRA
jgi:oxygen-dependent protoporphyrinogen oxidase